ncbi:recombinase family protein [Paraburkholderia nemoris]|uniref:recombinase family protein n=1 Tax=Paraburkholderia nemoris TaxID=2793076 RepID=UPI0038B9B7A2
MELLPRYLSIERDMSKTFLYARVSTSEQTTANQVLLAEKAGYVVANRHVYAETISGTVAAMERPMFAKLDEGDKLVVTKLDRLGRNARDIDAMVAMLRDMKVAVIVLDLPVMEVTSAAGDLVLRVFAAFAQFATNWWSARTRVLHGLGQRVGYLASVVADGHATRRNQSEAGGRCHRAGARERVRCLTPDYRQGCSGCRVINRIGCPRPAEVTP